MNYCVITTVNNPTAAVKKLQTLFDEGLIIVADKKTPDDWDSNGLKPVKQISKKYAPDNHYAKKNIGYMVAIAAGASLIYDIDDDNLPNDNWEIRTDKVSANDSMGEGWYNAYDMFSGMTIWPRGFSLKNIKKSTSCGMIHERNSSIQQGLADGDPDVDAIWRLAMKKNITFKNDKSIYLKPMAWCPFNSQSTWWFPKAYPLMYLPVTASFRMTDIWRSFVAQRCLWELGEGVTFHSPSEVFQDRNEHDLLKDFEDEIPGYLNNDKIVEVLSDLVLFGGSSAICGNMLTCYKALVREGFLPEEELISLNEWIKDYETVTRNLG